MKTLNDLLWGDEKALEEWLEDLDKEDEKDNSKPVPFKLPALAHSCNGGEPPGWTMYSRGRTCN